MTDPLQPTKFYPYYRVSFHFINNGEEYSFSYPENWKDKNAFGSLATNIEITKSEQGVLSSLAMRIYNMGENKRNLLFKEPYFIIKNNTSEECYSFVHLEIGYLTYENNQKYLEWDGEIINASSYKQGDNVITEIVARQMVFIDENAYIQTEIKKGDSVSEVLEKTIPQIMENANYGEDIKKQLDSEGIEYYIDNLAIQADIENDYKFQKDKVINDTLPNTINTLTSYIPNGRVAIKENQYFVTDKVQTGEPEFIINAESGLQSTPKIYGERITLTTMFEPAIDISSLVKVESVIEPNINGDYTVMGYTHSLTLGDGTNASAVTNLNLLMQGLAE